MRQSWPCGQTTHNKQTEVKHLQLPCTYRKVHNHTFNYATLPVKCHFPIYDLIVLHKINRWCIVFLISSSLTHPLPPRLKTNKILGVYLTSSLWGGYVWCHCPSPCAPIETHLLYVILCRLGSWPGASSHNGAETCGLGSTVQVCTVRLQQNKHSENKIVFGWAWKW